MPGDKNFFQDKWLKDQFNERNPGQRSDPNKPSPKQPDTLPNPDDVLRVMLNTPPQPHAPKVRKKASKRGAK